MECPECGEEITACPSCGGSLEDKGTKPDKSGEDPVAASEDEAVPEEEGSSGSEEETGEKAAAKEGLTVGQLKIRRHVLIGGMALLVIGVAAIILAFAVLPDHTKSSSPKDTVDAYFQAMQDNRQMDVLNLYDPADLETWAQMYGMTLDEFKSQMAGAEGDTPQASYVFEDIAYDVTVDGDQATVNITGGTAILTDATGQTQSLPMADTNLSMVKKDNKWYLKLLGDTSTQSDTSSVDNSTSDTTQTP